MPKTKVCGHCGTRKAVERFFQRKQGQLRPECKDCTKAAREPTHPNQKRSR